MSAAGTAIPPRANAPPGRAAAGLDPRRLAPTVLAGALAATYVIVSPPSEDLPAHLLRAKLFATQGFGLWNNWWYAGHHIMLYSVLFPALGAALTPQLVAGLAATATAAAFESLAHRRFGADAWLGALWFGAATASTLFAGQLTFAFGMLPATCCTLALGRRRPTLAAALAVLTALSSPVAALFAALAGAAGAIGRWWPERSVGATVGGVAVILAALLPVGLLAVAFPEGGYEPFVFSAFLPLPLIAIAALAAVPRRETALRAGILLYGLGCVASFAIPTAAGSNVARLGELLAGPLAALVWWPHRRILLLAAAPVLLYLQWHGPVTDVAAVAGDPAARAAYYRPLLSFLERQPGPPFRVEIPFTSSHEEAYAVAPYFPLARGWERQLDVDYNKLFYDGSLTPATYHAWLRSLAVRFVAVPGTSLDYSARAEVALIDRGLPYLRLVDRTRNWRIFAVRDATPIVQGAAVLRRLGSDSLALEATHAGTAYVRVRFTPYWALAQGSGCVAPDGGFTKLTLRQAGPVRIVIRFSLSRIGARSPRCDEPRVRRSARVRAGPLNGAGKAGR